MAPPSLTDPAQASPQPTEVLAGSIECVTFHNAENGFCVLRIKASGHRELQQLLNPDPTEQVERFGRRVARPSKATYGLAAQAMMNENLDLHSLHVRAGFAFLKHMSL